MPSNASNATELATQQKGKQITGTITDSRGVPVIGATVLKVGTTNAAITDLDGHFTLNARPGVKLKISYIGLPKDILVTVGSTNEYNIELKEDTEAIEEIVVVGYAYPEESKNLTGAIATISSDKLVNRTSANVTNMLAGQMPGVTVIQNSGQPGADGGLLRVRGLGTMGNASAMVVIDGVESTMSSVDPNDIENISILKDAAASAIYGVRAANGVILITTKKGFTWPRHRFLRRRRRLAECNPNASVLIDALRLCNPDERSIQKRRIERALQSGSPEEIQGWF